MYEGSGDSIKLKAIPGGPADRGQSATDAAKQALITTAAQNMDEIKSMILNYDDAGQVAGVNRTNILNSNVPGGGTPFTQGRTLNAVLKDALEGKIRAESGAAVPATEVARLAERFRPSILDSEETVVRKIKLLQDFLDNTMSFMRPDGSFDADAAVLSVDSALRTGGDFSQLSDDQLLQIMAGGQ
jgi:hypothetical protein